MADNKITVEEEKNLDLMANEAARNEDIGKIDAQYNPLMSELDKTIKDAYSEYTIDATDGKTTAVEKLMNAQNAATEQAIEEINQQKEQAQKDYEKEQAGAYADWKKQSDPFGANAEKMASAGLTNTGYAESTQAQMYSTYQSRVASARESFEKAKLNFSNAITNARLQNSATLAQIAFDAFQKQSEIALNGITMKQGLLSDWTNQKLAVNSRYDDNWRTILDNIYKNDALKQDNEQFYKNLEQQQAQFNTELKQKNEQFYADMENSNKQAQLERDWQTELKKLTIENDNIQTNKTNLKELITSTGYQPTDEQLKNVGMTRAEADAYLQYYKDNNIPLGEGEGAQTKSVEITSNFENYLANGDVRGAEKYLADALKNETITKDQYYNEYFNLAVNNEITAENVTEEMNALTKWYNSGKISYEDFKNLSKYYYGQLGVAVAPKESGVKIHPNAIEIDGISYWADTNAWKQVKDDKKLLLNGIATGSENKEPSVGTIVRYDGETYAYMSYLDSNVKKVTGWTMLHRDEIGKQIDKYLQTHEVNIPPEHTTLESKRTRKQNIN